MKTTHKSRPLKLLTSIGFGVAVFVFSSLQNASAQWITFDPTNFIQNTTTAIESVAATTQRSAAYVAQLKQYETMLTNLKRVSPSSLDQAVGHLTQGQTELATNMGGLDKLRDINSLGSESSRVSGSISNGQASVSSLIQLQQSMGGLQQSYSSRFEEARRLNLTWEQYALQQDLQIRSRVATAASRAQEDINRNERVKRDYEFAQDMAQKIPEAEGVQQSMGIMNTQMNRVVTQLAEVNKGLTSSLAAKTPGDVAAEEQAKQRELDNKRARLKNILTQRQADAKAITNWNP
jgi:hypothetical protein